MRNLIPIFCACSVSLPQSSSSTLIIGRIAYRREGVFFPIEMHYRPGKEDGSAQRGRSMLSTIALFDTGTRPQM